MELVPSELKLTKRQEAFCYEYVANGGNATQAAIKAGYSEKGAKVRGHELVTHSNAKALITKLWSDKLMSAEERMARLAGMARGEIPTKRKISADGDSEEYDALSALKQIGGITDTIQVNTQTNIFLEGY